jgi:hypothetical protein
MFLNNMENTSTPLEMVDCVEATIKEYSEVYEGEITINLRTVLDLPDGFVAIGGSYDHDDDVVEIFLAAKNPYDNINLTKEYLDWINHEIAKTLVHEGIHRIQSQEGRYEEVLNAVVKGEELSHKKYLSSNIELEAYGRADIKMDLEKYGTSSLLDEYIEIFGRDSEEVSIVKRYAGEDKDEIYI